MDENFKKELKKANLAYCIELFVFAIIFIVLGILKILGIIGKEGKDWLHTIFNYVTILGAIWTVSDFTWTLLSKKRRSRNSIFDKALTLPLAPVLLSFDIYCIIFYFTNEHSYPDIKLYNYVVGAIFIYFGLVYITQTIYHYFKPVPMIIEAVYEELEKEKKAEEENKQNQEIETQNNEESK